MTVSSNRPFVLAALVRVQAMEENEEAARDILASLETAAENYISAKIHLGLGGHDKVFEWLQKGVAKHVVRMPS